MGNRVCGGRAAGGVTEGALPGAGVFTDGVTAGVLGASGPGAVESSGDKLSSSSSSAFFWAALRIFNFANESRASKIRGGIRLVFSIRSTRALRLSLMLSRRYFFDHQTGDRGRRSLPPIPEFSQTTTMAMRGLSFGAKRRQTRRGVLLLHALVGSSGRCPSYRRWRSPGPGPAVPFPLPPHPASHP